MSQAEDAARRLDDARNLLGFAVEIRDFVHRGEIERANSVRREFDTLMLIRSAVSAPLAERFPRLPRILELVAKANQ